MNARSEESLSLRRKWPLFIALTTAALLVFLARLATDYVLPPLPEVRPAQVSALTGPAVPAPISVEEAGSQQARQARIESEKQQIEQERLRRAQKLAEAIAAREQAAEIARLDQERIDQAWSRHYKKPKNCGNTSEQSNAVECSNHYMRERQKFEKLWAEGKISAR